MKLYIYIYIYIIIYIQVPVPLSLPRSVDDVQFDMITRFTDFDDGIIWLQLTYRLLPKSMGNGCRWGLFKHLLYTLAALYFFQIVQCQGPVTSPTQQRRSASEIPCKLLSFADFTSGNDFICVFIAQPTFDIYHSVTRESSISQSFAFSFRVNFSGWPNCQSQITSPSPFQHIAGVLWHDLSLTTFQSWKYLGRVSIMSGKYRDDCLFQPTQVTMSTSIN